MLVPVLMFISAISSSADVLDTLSAFNPKSIYRWYRIPGLQVQAARFEPVAAGYLRRVNIRLAGENFEGTARLRFFGYEGGGVAPFLMQDLTDPVIVRKSRAGLEAIDVELPKQIRIDNRQFFVAVDQLSPGVTLVTDSEEKPVCCEDESEVFRYQCLQTSDGRWWTGKYGFAIDVVMAYDREPTLTWLVDMTENLGLADTAQVSGGIAWADYNEDGSIDVLYNGRLYENRQTSFVDVSNEAGLYGKPDVGLFMDADNDSHIDLLFLNKGDSLSKGGATLFLAREQGGFNGHSLELPVLVNPTSFSIADADLDGYLDLFIGQGHDAEGKPLPNFLLLNNHKGGFVDRTDRLYGQNAHLHASQGSQWVDVDDDGFLDLYVVNQGENGAELWRGNGDGTFSILFGPQNQSLERLFSVNTLGGGWHYADGDRYPDLIAPQHTTIERLAGNVQDIEAVFDGKGLQSAALQHAGIDRGVEFVEKRGSGSWADVNNDGQIDLFFSSASPCRNANLYLSTTPGSYAQQSSQFGLLHLPAGPDGVWVDYDNDGKLDLATLVNGRFHLYRNTIDVAGNYAEVEVDGADMTGLKVDIHVGERIITREVSSGRGLLMQDPLRLHFGIGDKKSIDSLRVRWPGGGTQTFGDIKVNALNRLHPASLGSAGGAVLADVRAFPNPFSDNLTIGFELKTRSQVNVVIYDLQANVVGRPHEGVLDAGVQNVVWSAVGDDGTPMPQGTYLYRVIAGSEIFNGRVVLGR